MYSGTPARDDRRLRHANSIVKNEVYKATKDLEDRLGGGTVSFIYLDQGQLDRLAGVSRQELERIPSAKVKSYRLSRYREFFSQHPVDLNALDSLRVLPKSITTIRRLNPGYDELVDLFVGENVHDPRVVTGIAYLRSIRVTLVRIENISNRNLSSIRFHMRHFSVDHAGEFRPIANSPPGGPVEEIPFAIDTLQPGETITLPLSIEAVPVSYAQGEVYPQVGMQQSATFQLSRHVTLANDNSMPEAFTIRAQDKPTPFAFGPAVYLEHVTWKVGDREFQYGRPMAKSNLIYGNGNCECGSCPVVSAQNRFGDWRKMGEVLTDAISPRIGSFTIALPGSAQQLMISENRGETTFVLSLVLTGVSTRGERRFLAQPVLNGVRRISYADPLIIDLRALHVSSPDLASVQLDGFGYYRSVTSNICPYVLPLPRSLFE